MVNTYPQLAVKGVGFNRTLGGLEMDIRLRNHLAALFNVSILEYVDLLVTVYLCRRKV